MSEYRTDFFFLTHKVCMGFPGGTSGKESTCNAGDIRDESSFPGLGRSSGGRLGKALQYSCLENPLDKGAWWSTVRKVANSQTWLRQQHTRTQGPYRCSKITFSTDMNFKLFKEVEILIVQAVYIFVYTLSMALESMTVFEKLVGQELSFRFHDILSI